MTISKKDFLKLCQRQNAEDTKAAMARANLHWYEGKPAPADDGFGAVKLSDDVTLTFSSDDLIALEEGDGKSVHRIGLKSDATVILTKQMALALDTCDCGPMDDDPMPTPTLYDIYKRVPELKINQGIGYLTGPGYTHPCISKGRAEERKCLDNGGDTIYCAWRGAATESQCWRSH